MCLLAHQPETKILSFPRKLVFHLKIRDFLIQTTLRTLNQTERKQKEKARPTRKSFIRLTSIHSYRCTLFLPIVCLISRPVSCLDFHFYRLTVMKARISAAGQHALCTLGLGRCRAWSPLRSMTYASLCELRTNGLQNR
uniref:Uncharacterized protein n=1 Tax=Utricularia reniformis TaxID=192314 RepID=A0A1Y0B184_9LAMI|nr:hypothetical protein AEK19_MT0925 [Utricularia reniformis]ART31151.1 hypothetical protein AEK19_MT0925 [Utricularia reniformis]